MSFHTTIARLREASYAAPAAGENPNTCRVRREDLRTALHVIDRLDADLRQAGVITHGESAGLPTFDAWYAAHHNDSTFEHDHMRPGTSFTIAAMALAQLLRDYVSDMARSTGAARPGSEQPKPDGHPHATPEQQAAVMRLTRLAGEARAIYGQETYAGGEPTYPAWTDDVLVLAGSVQGKGA